MGVEELYQTTTEEVKEPIETEILGEIPEWIEGSLYRNGPGKFEFGDTKCNHWFDGMALLHRFKVSGGKVTYQNRYLESDTYKKNMKADRFIVSEYGTAAYPDPCKNIFQRFFSHFQRPEPTDNTVVNVFPLGDALYTSTETKYINQIDFETLERLNKVDLTKVVSVNKATAHPHRDPDGTIHNLGTITAGKTSYAFIKISPSKPGDGEFCEKAEIVAKIPAQMNMKPSYYHSFGMTENYYILIEQPMIINAWKLLTMNISSTPYNRCMEWHPEMQTKFHIVDKKTGEKVNQEVSYQSAAFYTFHHVNAYEEEGCIILDLIAYGNGIEMWEVINEAMSVKTMQAERVEKDYLFEQAISKARRYVLPIDFDKTEMGTNLVRIPEETAEAVLKEGNDKTNSNVKFVMHCTEEILSETHVEFPTVNYWGINTKKYRYIYANGTKVDLFSLVRIDVQTKEVLTWQEEGVFPSEPVFIAAPNATEEDDGVILSVALNLGEERCAFLLVLNAKDMKEIGRAKVGVKIPRDLHSVFVPNK